MSGARVYLMADFGHGPVALAGRRKAPAQMPVRVVGQTGNQYSERASAWWLVEAESADAARAAIAETIVGKDGALAGRILASGGAK